MIIVQAVLVGILVVMAGTIPRNIFFAANLRFYNNVPWAVVVTGVYLVFFWKYLKGEGPPASTADTRRMSLRANGLTAQVWAWALSAGVLGLIALVLGLRLANRMVMLPPQPIPDLSQVPKFTILSLLLASAPFAGIIEEAGFRGYMQGPIERRYGMPVAILITGTMFAVVHLDFSLILWPYYVAVAAIYGTVTCLTRSILPAVMLHTSGNIYSGLDLWLYGQAEWQAASSPSELIWKTGADASFWIMSISLVIIAAASVMASLKLARVVRNKETHS